MSEDRERFWPRFGLRTLFVVLTLLCVGMAALFSQLPAFESVKVHDDNGTVRYVFNMPNPRFWIVAGIEILGVLGWVVYRDLRRRRAGP